MKKRFIFMILIGIVTGILLSAIYVRFTGGIQKESSSANVPSSREDSKIRQILDEEGKSLTVFVTSDILDWREFLTGLKTHNAPGEKRIWEFLDEKTRKEIEAWNTDESPSISLRKSVVDGLNKILERKDFYNKRAFSGIKLDKSVIKLLKKGVKKLSEREVVHLNRLLFEEIYPTKIAKSNRLEFVYYAMAKQMSRRKDYEGALEYINKALEINPDSVLYIAERATIHEFMADEGKMKEDLKKILEAKPGDIEAVRNLAAIYADEGKERKALNLINNAMDRISRSSEKPDPVKIAELYFARSGVYYYLEKYDKAFEDLNKSIELNPDSLEYAAERVTFNERLGKMKKAKEAARYVLNKFPPPETSLDYQNYGVAYRVLGNNEKAIEFFDTSAELNPANHIVIYERALAHLQNNDTESARRDLKEVIRLDAPDKEEALELLNNL